MTRDDFSDSDGLDLRTYLQVRYSQSGVHWFTNLFDLLELPPDAHLLELGCGSGLFWLQNAERVPPGWQIVLSDSAPGMAFAAQAALHPLRLAALPLAAASERLPFAAEQFDALLAVGVLDLVSDLPRTLAELRRVLRPGGRLYAATSAGGHLAELSALVQEYAGAGTYGVGENPFLLENGEAVLGQAGFTELRTVPIPDQLTFDAAEPVLAYARSEGAMEARLAGAALAQLKDALERQISAAGQFSVRVRRGLVIGRRPVE